jgi:hypothetical protein
MIRRKEEARILEKCLEKRGLRREERNKGTQNDTRKRARNNNVMSLKE